MANYENISPISDGNVAATIFYLKVKAGWREKK